MFNLHQEISTPIGVVIIVSFAFIVGAVIFLQSMEAIEEIYSVENQMLSKNY